MIRKIVCVLFLGIVSLTFAQEKIAEFKNTLKTSTSNVKTVFPIVDQETGETAIFLSDAKNVYGYKLNHSFKLIEKLKSEEKRRKYKVLIGSSISDNGDYNVYLTNKNHTKYAILTFSFKNKKSTIKEFTLRSSNEKFIQTASINNRFYLITASKKLGFLYVYSFNENGVPLRKKIDINALSFIDKLGTLVKVTNLLIKNNTFTSEESITKFEENTPVSIDSASEYTKMYMKGNSLLFTFDTHKVFTQILTLNLTTFEVGTKVFKKPLDTNMSVTKKTNSFIHDKHIFLVASTRDIFSMQIVNYETNNTLKEYTVKKKAPITFKNSPIIQTKSSMYGKGIRRLEKTKQFLRKITTGKIGVSVIKQDSIYAVSIGGYVEQNFGNGGMMLPRGFGNIPLMAMGNISFSFNPVFYAYNSFKNTKSTKIECVFDENFNHLENEKTPQNAFKRMQRVKTEYGTGETIFKYRDYYIRGYYHPSKRMYILYKFPNVREL